MSILSNILLAIATLLVFALFDSFFLAKAPRTGDAAMGYTWGLIFMYLALLVCMIIVAGGIGWNNGFQWVSGNGGMRWLLVSGGLVLGLSGAAIAGLFRGEPGIPFLLNLLGGFVPYLVPALMVFGAAFLVNKGWQTAVAPTVYQGALILAVALGAISAAAAVWVWIGQNQQNAQRRMERNMEEYDANQARIMQEIDTCDVQKNMVFILVFTDANQTEAVRSRAVAKVKSRPDWQEELVRRLQNDWAPEAFNFLASNPVDNPALFPEAVRTGVEIQARLIRENIRRSSHPSHFYPEQFTWEIERVLRTVDAFSGQGVDFKPAVAGLRSALNEPTDIAKPTFRCAALLDKWLASAASGK